MSFKTHAIPQSTVEALTKAKERGVEIYISTGRPYALVTNIGSIEHLIDGYITTNTNGRMNVSQENFCIRILSRCSSIYSAHWFIVPSRSV